MTETRFAYHYPFASTVVEVPSGEKAFAFAHCSEIEADNKVPCFWWGRVKAPFAVAKCLVAMSRTVGSHFAIAPGTFARMRDPILSAGSRGVLFEAFSSCNSVYTRLTLPGDCLDGELLQSGCTNIDFNPVTIRALQGIGLSDRLIMGIGSKETHFVTSRHTAKEKKVTLSNRWIKGLGNVQIYLSQLEEVATLNRIQALQLWASIPRTAVKTSYYLHRRGTLWTFSPAMESRAVKAGGAHRLQLVAPLLPLCSGITIYGHAEGRAMAVVLHVEGAHMLFLFSEDVYKGFSGDGLYLEEMTGYVPAEWLSGLNSRLKATECFTPSTLADALHTDRHTLAGMQASLSALGLLGYEPVDKTYFYRRLPFKAERLATLHPRLENARRLLNDGYCQPVERQPGFLKALVKGSQGMTYTVTHHDNEYRCTCSWFISHHTARGFCKHILAVKMWEEAQDTPAV